MLPQARDSCSTNRQARSYAANRRPRLEQQYTTAAIANTQRPRTGANYGYHYSAGHTTVTGGAVVMGEQPLRVRSIFIQMN